MNCPCSLLALALALVSATVSCAGRVAVASDPPPAEQAQQLYEEGLRLAAQGRRRDAVSVWETGIAIDPENTEMLVALGGALVVVGNDVRARELLDRAARLGPPSAQLDLELGRLHLRLHEYEDAKAAFSGALRRDPSLYAAKMGWVEAEVGLGHCEPARAKVKQWPLLRYSPKAYRLLAECTPSASH